MADKHIPRVQAGRVLTAEYLNTHIIDNIEQLKQEITDRGETLPAAITKAAQDAVAQQQGLITTGVVIGGLLASNPKPVSRRSLLGLSWFKRSDAD